MSSGVIEGETGHVQLDLYPSLVFRLCEDGRSICLCTSGLHVSVNVIVHDGWYLGIASDMLLTRVSTAAVSSRKSGI